MTTTTANDQLEGLGTYKFGWADSDVAGASAKRGLSEAVVRDISEMKNEPKWMTDFRLKCASDLRAQADAELGR